jgi:hypothetical protein
VSTGSVEWFRFRPQARLAHDGLRAAIVAIYAGVPVLVTALGWGSWLFLQLFCVAALPLLFFAAVPLMAGLVATADIAVEVEGIRLHAFGPWRVFIPWEAMKHSSVWQTRPPAHLRLMTLRRWEQVNAIYIPGLDSLAPVGMYFGLGRTPVFIITPEHERHERLMQRIEHMHHPLKQATAPKPRQWRSPRRK